MKKGSLRLRYFISYLLMLIPICIFALVNYFSVVTQTRLSTKKNRLQQLNYASESLSAMLTRLDDAVQLSELSEKLLQEERMASGWTGEEECGQTLSALEQRIAPGSELMVFRRGDNAAYSKNGRQTYGEWERAFAQDYNMRISSAFSALNYGCRTMNSSAQSACLASSSFSRRFSPFKSAVLRSAISFFSRPGRIARPITSIRPMFSFLM